MSTSRTIIIEEVGKPIAAPKQPSPRRFDLQDALIAVGILTGETAALVIWWPAALILACLFCFGFAYMIEIARAKEQKKLGTAKS